MTVNEAIVCSMRSTLVVTVVLAACQPKPPEPPAPIEYTVLAPKAAGPDTIPCERPIQVKAKSDRLGVREERDWLDEHYPGHRGYRQALLSEGGRHFDVLDFSLDGREISVCFDITSSFGHY